MRDDLVLDRVFFALALALGAAACAGPAAGAPPPNRCTGTMTSLQALEPACWAEVRDGGTEPTEASAR